MIRSRKECVLNPMVSARFGEGATPGSSCEGRGVKVPLNFIANNPSNLLLGVARPGPVYEAYDVLLFQAAAVVPLV